MGFQLRRETEDEIQRRISTGKYGSPDEVVLAGLELLDERDRRKQRDLNEVRRKIADGVADLDRGDMSDGQEFINGLLAELEEDDDSK